MGYNPPKLDASLKIRPTNKRTSLVQMRATASDSVPGGRWYDVTTYDNPSNYWGNNNYMDN